MSNVGGSDHRNTGRIIIDQEIMARARFMAEALAIYAVSGFYCLVYHDKAIVETMKWVSSAYFLPGATLAFLVGLFGEMDIKVSTPPHQSLTWCTRQKKSLPITPSAKLRDL